MRTLIAASILAIALASPHANAQTINVATAGDQNMVDYVRDYLGPMFEKKHPGVKVVAVGTGPGDGGSQKIYEKLAAQKAANAPAWDFDVIVVHQKMAGQMVGEQLLAKYRDKIETGKLVSRETAANALGAKAKALSDQIKAEAKKRSIRACLLPMDRCRQRRRPAAPR